MSRDYTTALQPGGRQRLTLSQNIEKNKKKERTEKRETKRDGGTETDEQRHRETETEGQS